jgi:hypothetical protein
LKLLNVNALSVAKKEGMLALLKNGTKLALVTFSEDLSEMKESIELNGVAGHILLANDDGILLSVDDSLILFRDNESKTVLRAHRAGNVFWHACKFHEKILVQEYGQAPTSIYASGDFLDWEEVVSNLDIDRHSKHFHDIVYDPYRDQLIATLGDGNYVRAICSDNGGLKWRSLFAGAWQFLPIVPLEDKIVFGMDSGFASGGVGIYDYIDENWAFMFLKWVGKDKKIVQMCDLERLDNGLWLSGLGTPQALLFSENLEQWYPLYIEKFDNNFNPYMQIAEGKTRVICTTGQNLLSFEKEELAKIQLNSKPVLVEHRAFKERLMGTGFVVRRKIENMLPDKRKTVHQRG